MRLIARAFFIGIAVTLGACATPAPAWRDITQVREGMTAPEVLAVMGEPDRRQVDGRSATLLWAGGDGGGVTLTDGRVTLVMSSAVGVIAPLNLRAPEPTLAPCGAVPFRWADVQRVRNGMTEAEVVRIIGPPCTRSQSGAIVVLGWSYMEYRGGITTATFMFEGGIVTNAQSPADPAPSTPAQPVHPVQIPLDPNLPIER